ncbi:substrate carrier family protein N [Seminavis robusta]|uniref:Substrate carrier family protein N n=1 Tax=Seminavis robusta TaxID=568900 RepID=A0A9N8EHU2_9STRA|nr:substrate carrier family protein N [Seminavis robusta]|eukprot:Sro1157_g247320.1 substrate carrier family protein N (598) ;mRNA; f:1848-3827
MTSMNSAPSMDENSFEIEKMAPSTRSFLIGRRSAVAMAAAAAAILPSLGATAISNSEPTASLPLDDFALGDGMWKQLKESKDLSVSALDDFLVPAYFATYAARFLVNYDEAIASWWRQEEITYSLLGDEKRQSKLGKSFGSMARSIQIALDSFIRQPKFQNNPSEAFAELLGMFLSTYGRDQEAKRQIGLLFSMLPSKDIPDKVGQFAITQQTTDASADNNIANDMMSRDYSALLPAEYRVVKAIDDSLSIQPPLRVYAIGESGETGQTATGTPFGPLASTPLIRERPSFSPSIYGLFGISGATGCALTHSVVIPLDVVKTRAQTNPDEFSDLLAGSQKIVQEEGIQGLLLGAQATLAGYFWYGLSVYPSYTFFKRLFTQTVLAPEVSAIHANDISLVAGAFAAVIASIGLTPLEAARIRVVADPDTYRPLGLSGTLDAIAAEDKDLGWQALYAGFPSLLSRQVIFGSIKFLAFERTSEAIFAAAPGLRDATWTALTVSLVAGGLSGAVSSIVSQPADSLLTFVAQNNRGTSSMGLIDGCRVMIREDGVGSLFRGLSSRCLWAGSIIAGQFLLYDVFRTLFGVTNDDLSQVYQISIQ